MHTPLTPSRRAPQLFQKDAKYLTKMFETLEKVHLHELILLPYMYMHVTCTCECGCSAGVARGRGTGRAGVLEPHGIGIQGHAGSKVTQN